MPLKPFQRIFFDIEHASYDSWPALEQIDRASCILRFAGGYTKRANSVNVLSNEFTDAAQFIDECETAYHSRNLPCIFRLLSFNNNSVLEAGLDQRGYIHGDHSRVLIKDFRHKEFSTGSIQSYSREEWLPVYCRLSEKDLSDHEIHGEMIRRIEKKTLFAVKQKTGVDVSCALGVICNGYFGLFDMVTHPDYRHLGFGTELISGMLSWAKQHGATAAYLQVVADNLPAIKLYHKLGYEPAYEYHYRIQAL